ncbi:MAG: hypothetical protein AB1631_07085 [Acidobacteriota bacterium]
MRGAINNGSRFIQDSRSVIAGWKSEATFYEEAMTDAIVIATDHAPEIESMNEPRPVALFDRLFIQHARKYPVDQAAKFDFVLSHLSEKLHEFFEDGSRWGSHLRRHPTRDAAYPYRLLKSFETGGSPISLAHADRLPQTRLDQREPAHESGPATVITPDQYGSESGRARQSWLPASLITDGENFFHCLIALKRNTT